MKLIRIAFKKLELIERNLNTIWRTRSSQTRIWYVGIRTCSATSYWCWFCRCDSHIRKSWDAKSDRTCRLLPKWWKKGKSFTIFLVLKNFIFFQQPNFPHNIKNNSHQRAHAYWIDSINSSNRSCLQSLCLKSELQKRKTFCDSDKKFPMGYNAQKPNNRKIYSSEILRYQAPFCWVFFILIFSINVFWFFQFRFYKF